MPDTPPVRRRTRATTRRAASAAAPEAGISDALTAHLAPMTAPYLFVGAGLSIRYVDAEGWADLLTRFCEPTGKPYEYYASTADGSLPRVATLLAERFHEVWWEDERYAASREAFKDIAVSRDSALKIEISRHLASAIDHCMPFLSHDHIDPDELREFLIANRQAFDEHRQPLESQWARAVCIYDWIAYGQRA